ncbi:MAG: chromosome segregation protein SMC [Acidobacteriia bacterium]|nr:chromosome segregation protein SMC [Terriglobia bacterium]
MLRLSRIQMIGFKSFCEKAEIMFAEGAGVTAIVGPNGCGKSNIADAIAWVLGEQSVKSLRGSSMEDVIFNGTRERQPMGLAQVSLTLVDPEFTRESVGEVSPVEQEEMFEEAASPAGQLSGSESEPAAVARRRKRFEPKPGEVVVTRKLYRSGESEYYLNGRLCRLRDIQELFLGTGLGPNSYAIIEQGRVGQILSSKPMDRRMLIEEAAGTTKYKAKRKLAEAKLESAKLNLSRVNDIIEEVTRQLNSLKRQAAKARRYHELREEMRAKLTAILFSQLIEFEETIQNTQQELAAASSKAEESRQTLQAQESEQQATQQRSFELEDLLRRQQEELAENHLQLDRAQHKKVYSHEQLGAIEQRLADFEKELGVLAEQIQSRQTEIDVKRQDDAGIQNELAAVEAETAENEAAVALLGEQHQAGEVSLSALRAKVLDTVQRAATLNNQIVQIDDAEARMAAHDQRLQREWAEAQSEQGELTKSQTHLKDSLQSETAAWKDVTAELQALSSECEAARSELSDRQTRWDVLKQQQADGLARQHSLEEIVKHHAYVDEGVRQLLSGEVSPPSSTFKPLGILADFVEVESEFEAGIEEFLKDELEFILVETSDLAHRGIEILRNQTGGRSTFVVARRERIEHAALTPQEKILGEQGVVATVASKIRFEGPFAAIVDQILPGLSDAYVVQSFEAADRLSTRYPDAVFVTMEGDVFQGCWIRGGRKSSVGPLALKRELRSLASTLAGIEKEIVQTEKDRADLKERIANLEATIQSRTARKIELEKEQVVLDHQTQQMESDLARVLQKVALLGSERSRLETERQEARTAQATMRRELEACQSAQQSIDAEIAAVTQSFGALKAQSESINARISELKSSRAALSERKTSSQKVLDRLEEQLLEARQRRERIEQQQAAALEEQRSLRLSLVETEAGIAQLAQNQTDLEQNMTTRQREAEESRRRLLELEEQLKVQREMLSGLMEARSGIEVQLAKQESELAHVRQASQQELDRPWEELRLLQTTRLQGEALSLAEAEYGEMRQKIESMGAINMMALEEYGECEQRFNFLSTQRKDLLDSIADTIQTIQEIETVSRQQFQEAFECINEYFRETFKQLFGGGSGSMELTDATDLQQSGIDLQVQPPGKKLQNVLLLSGGEKALTAIALLLAIFRYQPSPFCVLDEVDAPLDEANVDRFSRMIATLSGETHFIVITHNKKTMEIARAMYGVTMQEAGVSKLVSVRFE